MELRRKVGLWSRCSGDEKALVKVELWSADKGEALAKGGFLMRVEFWSRSSGDDRLRLFSRAA